MLASDVEKERLALKISIITPAFNRAPVLAYVLQSVLSQSWTNYELIVVDGGSSDGTVNLLERASRLFGSRLRWLSGPDRGLYDAINKGIRISSGDVIGVLNSDDFYSGDSVLETVASTFLTRPNVDAVYGDVRFIPNGAECSLSASDLGNCGSASEALRVARLRGTIRYYSGRHWAPWMLRWGVMAPHPSLYVRRGIFDRFGVYSTDYRIASDFDWMLRCFKDSEFEAVYVRSCLVTMRQGGISTRGFRSNMLINREIVRALRGNGLYANLLMMLPKYFCRGFEVLIPRVYSVIGRQVGGAFPHPGN